jgi:FkbM family methyltransferase
MVTNFHENEQVICKFIPSNNPPKVLLDVGVGPKTEYLTLSEAYPDMLIVGLEPLPSCFNNLISKFPGILLPYAAWHQETSLELYPNTNNPEATSVFPSEAGEKQALTVYTRTLDSIDRYLGYPDRILMWMDIEGAELMALKGARELLSSGRVRWINLEARDQWNRVNACTKVELDNFLAQFGYQEKLQYNHHNRESPYGHRDVIYLHENQIQEWSEIKNSNNLSL